MKKGILVVVSGFSGAGKGTLMKALLNHYDNYALSISATTRKPREGEMDGREYFFLSHEEFEKRIGNNEFIEYAQYVSNYYGTPKAYVESKLKDGKDVILEIEIQGAVKIKEKFPDALLIFVTPPDAKTLKERLVNRGTEKPEQIEARLKRAAQESEWINKYDYLIINDNIDIAVDDLHNLINTQHFKVSHNKELVNKIQFNMNKEYLKEE